jgi:ubiquinone/menaquinone biosynthesis C-methylase UbiE
MVSEMKKLSKEKNKIKEDQEKFHNERAEIYDSQMNLPFWKAYEKLTIDKWVLSLKNEITVLDLGCGTGRCTLKCVEKGIHVVGLDILRRMLNVAIQNTVKDRDHITFLLGDAENLPFTEGYFDAIISFGTLHHLPNPKRAIEEIGRVLKVGGFFFAFEPNSRDFLYPIDNFIAKKIVKVKEEHYHGKLNPKDVKIWLSDVGINAKIRTGAYRFIPYIRYYPKNVELSKIILQLIDAICERVPGIKGKGATIIIEGYK